MITGIIECIVLMLFINTSSSFADEDDPTLITLPYGQIKGHVLQNANGIYYYSFQEIPYAAPPVNRLRFKEPVPPSKWYGILETTKNSKICYQTNPPTPDLGLVETEDCLYLNVYVPANSTEALPVLVYIHGGGYAIGDATFQSYGPQFFIDYNIAVVTLNYRLGPLGFLTTEDGVIPGNLGLKDQNLAIKWVKDNIELFGGDPAKITINGVSAGASSVGLHLVSKKSAGLFRGAILESGTALSSFSYQPFARDIAFEAGSALDSNFTSENSTDLLSLLQSLSAVDITNVEVTAHSQVDTGAAVWRPVIEDETLEEAFITGPMYEDIKNGNINQVPIIIGFNSEEELTFLQINLTGFGGLSFLKDLAVELDNDVTILINDIFNMTEEDKYTAGSQLKQIYTNGTFEDDFGALIRYASDWIFTTPAIKHAELQSNYTDVYLYQFSYNGQLGQNLLVGQEPIDIEGIDPNGVGHGAEASYLWNVYGGLNSDITKFPARDRLVQGYLLKLWTNFIKYLNPTPSQDPSLQNVIWSKVSPDSLNYLNINSTLSLQVDPKEYKKFEENIDQYAIPPLTIY